MRAVVTRRDLLACAARTGGAGAAFAVMQGLGMAATSEASTIPAVGRSHGRGIRVVILGAGIAGLAAAIELEQAGYQCTIVEARSRPGGRNWTVRSGTHVDLVDGTKQTCRWDEGQYFNAGPGRLPSGHHNILGYCKRLGVKLEPEINTSRSALMQAPTLNGGIPVQQRRVVNDTRGYLSELLAKAVDKHTLDDVLTADDRERLIAFLRPFGDLDPSLRYVGSTRSGYAVAPGAGDEAERLHPPLPLRDLLVSDMTKGEIYEERINWQATMFQAVGGMDHIPYAMAKSLSRTPIQYDHEVIELRLSDAGVTIRFRNAGTFGEISTDYCINTLPLSIMRNLPNNLPRYIQSLFGKMIVQPYFKIAWQAPRFWESDNDIYGGLSFQKQIVDVLWYPSNDLFSEKGVLISGFNSETDIVTNQLTEFGRLPTLEARLAVSRQAVERLHPGRGGSLTQPIYLPWRLIPYSLGGVAEGDTPEALEAYRELNKPVGRMIFAGDYLSRLTGWQEGAILSAHKAVRTIIDRSRAGRVGTAVSA